MALRMTMGNEAAAMGALAAGCDFFAGYPITPATEILEEMGRRLPARGGVFLQMEDELAAMAAVIGAAWGGARAMTATSGPGFSLMQEHIGYAALTQTPCVVVDAQRGGPSTGLPTLPAQGDVMQARFGAHGDRPAIVLTASSVWEAYAATRQAFALAERHRTPVVVLLDAVIAHMREPVEIFDLPPSGRAPWPGSRTTKPPFGRHPFAPFGGGRDPIVVTGLSHGEDGLPTTGSGQAAERILKDSITAIAHDPELASGVEGFYLDDARWAVVAYGITARAALAAVESLRAAGVPVGLLKLHVLWPLPEAALIHLADRVDGILVAELNLGQLVMPIRAAVAGRTPVEFVGRADGLLLAPEEIGARLRTGSGSVVTEQGGRRDA